MTTITVYTSADGAVCGFLASGHAGGKKDTGLRSGLLRGFRADARPGVNALEAVAGVTPCVAVRDGYLKCELPRELEAGAAQKAQIVLQTVMTGLTDIQKVYPNLIRIQKEEWRQADAYDESSVFAHKKGTGSSHNGRDSESKRLGAKRADGQSSWRATSCTVSAAPTFIPAPTAASAATIPCSLWWTALSVSSAWARRRPAAACIRLRSNFSTQIQNVS